MSAIGAGAPQLLATLPAGTSKDTVYVRLAREIAMDIHPLDTILQHYQIGPDEWEIIKTNHRFNEYLRASIEEWNSATNTPERVKLKSLACVEESLEEFFGRMHDRTENLPAKVKALEVLTNIAGLGSKFAQAAGGGGEKFSVTINLGADQQLKISAPTPTAIDVGDQ